MPWKTDKDSKRHNKDAKGKHGKLWREVANRELAETGDEGRSIRIANAALRRAKRK